MDVENPGAQVFHKVVHVGQVDFGVVVDEREAFQMHSFLHHVSKHEQPLLDTGGVVGDDNTVEQRGLEE